MNYKKWDDMAKDLSDSDDENKKKKVRVTRLGQSSQVFAIFCWGCAAFKNLLVPRSQFPKTGALLLDSRPVTHRRQLVPHPLKIKESLWTTPNGTGGCLQGVGAYHSTLKLTHLHRFASTVSDSEEEEGEDEDEEEEQMDVEHVVEPTHVDQHMPNHEPSKSRPTSSEQSTAPPSAADGKQPASRNSFQALSFNGGSTEAYHWSQDKKEVDHLKRTCLLRAALMPAGA
jgi:hypothetical protein